MVDQIIEVEGERGQWRVLAKGAERDGEVYCHLASVSRGNLRRNGWCPIQIGVWLPVEKLNAVQ